MVVTGTSPMKRKHSSSFRENRATKTAGSQIIGTPGHSTSYQKQYYFNNNNKQDELD